jgi:hypothetical protein
MNKALSHRLQVLEKRYTPAVVTLYWWDYPDERGAINHIRPCARINASIPFVSFAQSDVAAPVRSHRQRSACPLPYRGMLTNH